MPAKKTEDEAPDTTIINPEFAPVDHVHPQPAVPDYGPVLRGLVRMFDLGPNLNVEQQEQLASLRALLGE